MTLSGYKSYLVGVAACLYGAGGVIFGYTDLNEALQFVMGGLGLGALRAGVEKNKGDVITLKDKV